MGHTGSVEKKDEDAAEEFPGNPTLKTFFEKTMQTQFVYPVWHPAHPDSKHQMNGLHTYPTAHLFPENKPAWNDLPLGPPAYMGGASPMGPGVRTWDSPVRPIVESAVSPRSYHEESTYALENGSASGSPKNSMALTDGFIVSSPKSSGSSPNRASLSRRHSTSSLRSGQQLSIEVDGSDAGRSQPGSPGGTAKNFFTEHSRQGPASSSSGMLALPNSPNQSFAMDSTTQFLEQHPHVPGHSQDERDWANDTTASWMNTSRQSRCSSPRQLMEEKLRRTQSLAANGIQSSEWACESPLGSPPALSEDPFRSSIRSPLRNLARSQSGMSPAKAHREVLLQAASPKHSEAMRKRRNQLPSSPKGGAWSDDLQNGTGPTMFRPT